MIPKYLKLRNFLSHDISEVDFDKFNVALILGTYDNETDQSNGCGKSSIVESIIWALFDRSRHKKKDGVVKWDKRACRVEFSFWVEDNLYKITRTRDKIIGESDVVFERFDGSEFVNIGCDTNTITDKKIIDTINVNYEVFVNSVYFKQDDISIFATTTPSKRKDVIKALLKMDKWDAYQKKTKERAKKLEAKIEEKSQSLVPVLELDSDLKNCRTSLVGLKKIIKNNNKLYSNINSNLITKKSAYQVVYGDIGNGTEKLKKLQYEFNIIKKQIIDIECQIEKHNKTIVANNNKISKHQQNIKIFKEQIKTKNSINIELFRFKIIEGRTKEKILNETVANLKKEIKLAGDCDLCKKPLTEKEIVVLKKQRKAELFATQDRYKNIQSKVIKASKLLQNKEQIIVTGSKAEVSKNKSEAKISQLQNEINICLKANTQCLIESKRLKSSDLKKEISALKDKFDDVKKEQLEEEISSLEKRATDTKKKGDKNNIEYGSKIRRRNEIIKIQNEQVLLKKDINKLKGEFAIYDKLSKYFGKDGIQSIIIENIIEELENYSNETLAKICNEPTSISIKTQKQNNNGSWVETFDILVKSGARTDDFDTFSGGEKFRISLALRLALSNILANRMGGEVRFLLLDEVSSNLDNKGLDMFIHIVKQLGENIKILVITHNERLKELFEDIIVVNKGPNGSRVVES